LSEEAYEMWKVLKKNRKLKAILEEAIEREYQKTQSNKQGEK
jgi:hypothetical protein